MSEWCIFYYHYENFQLVALHTSPVNLKNSWHHIVKSVKGKFGNLWLSTSGSEDQPTTTRPPSIRLAERPDDESWEDDPSDLDSDHDLEDSPLDHTACSHDIFSIGSHIDIASLFLLDILSDAPVQKPAGSSRVSSKRPTVSSTLSASSAPLDDGERY
ncbi:hypothetical protein FIBSPDRAFT_889858 [Athelia psychrophila]|uniref:Uncharacterized protein n=1 Tax=Athelia psychrophila TaxID=1759441 RepID=A0A166LHE4_9AGAM|nr:hypothetical protein FIBSPDRAFT_889858 [Fibularhizoctonia sp. CBS 109695]